MKTKSKAVDHFAVAALCRANPGQWLVVGEYNSSQSACGVAATIRAAYIKGADRRSAYTPAGSFEARYRLTEYGARVEARFVPRTNTPDVVTVDADGFKRTTMTVKRACNGCSQYLGDVTDAEINRAVAGLPLPDVRAECARCAPLVELEAEGCRTWQLTPRNIAAVDDVVDRDGIYAKGYFESDGTKTVCVGLRIGTGETRIVARFGDHVIRDRDGRWSVRHAPADTGTEGQA